MAAEDAVNTTQRGILELRRRQMMGQGAAGAPATGSSFGRERIPGKPTIIGSAGPALRGAEEELWSKPGVRPEGSTDGGNVWITPGGGVVNKDARDPNTYSFNPKTGRVTGTQEAWDKGDGQFGMYSNGSSAPAAAPTATPTATPQRPSPAPLLARPRQGMIDGKPAGQVLSGMRENAARGTTPAQAYGADVAKRNIEERGPQAAIEDYFNRNRLDAQRAPMPTEPGNMAERYAADGIDARDSSAVGPAQRAMLDARRDRAERLVQGPPVSAMDVRPQGPPAPLSQSGPPASAMTVSQAGPPLLARPRAEAQPPALVQRTNELADKLRARANTPYQQRMTEGGITIDDMTKSLGSLPGKARRGLQRVREFSDRTNQWAENFRNSR